MAVDHVGTHTRSCCYIQGSTPIHENETKTNNLGWMLYLVYAVLWCMLYFGVCCTLVYVVLDVCCTQSHLMIMTWRDREQ